MKGGANPSPFAALAFTNSKKVPIHCWVDRESFPVAAWRSPASNSQQYGDFLHHNRAALTNRPRRISLYISKFEISISDTFFFSSIFHLYPPPPPNSKFQQLINSNGCITLLVMRRNWKECITQLYGPLDGMYYVMKFIQSPNELHSYVD